MKVTRRSVLKALTTTMGASALTDSLLSVAASSAPDRNTVIDSESAPNAILWYEQPAAQWLEALPIGNGRLGAMVHGGMDQEKLQLNEGTVWAGGPHDYDSPKALAALPEIRRLVFAEKWSEAQNLVDAKFLGRPGGQMPYQTVGDLLLTFPTPALITGYRRELNLEEAIACVSYTADGIHFHREAFASVPHQVIVLRLTADKPGSLSFRLGFDSPQQSAVSVYPGNTLALQGTGGSAGGIGGAIRFAALARILTKGGHLHADKDTLTIERADEVTVLISIATSYNDYQNLEGDALARAQAHLESASQHSYTNLRQTHLRDYQLLFKRVRLSLGSSDRAATAIAANKPTDKRVAAFQGGSDPQLVALHFHYGRYLLISSSRPGGQPATLQGLWNDSVTPPWGSKYTVNINTEMNYWPAPTTNLLECYAPLFKMISELSVAGKRTARTLYGAQGWVCHHNTDIWRGTAPVDGAFWGMWPMGGAWLCKNLWDHYEFTQDIAALKTHYPIMKSAALFFLDILVEEPTHRWLVTCPSISPENGHHPNASICAGPTMDNQILHDLFGSVAEASRLLNTDSEFRERLSTARKLLPPMQIGRQGQLQEWLEDWDAGAEEVHHRHVSHLYGLFPSSQITRRSTPALFDAARRSLETRGDMATGWSLAWKINLWARLEDGNRACKLLTDLLTPEHTAPNLFDLHPPFQIDGNFGAVSGVAEMLLQSHVGEIHLLPALPSVWTTGSVTGLRARGGYIVDLAWKDSSLSHATVQASISGLCTIRLGERVVTFPVQKGKHYSLDAKLTRISD